jgi:TATA-box binding protein (TBP) (component of TFIID and TFIIIB)
MNFHTYYNSKVDTATSFSKNEDDSAWSDEKLKKIILMKNKNKKNTIKKNQIVESEVEEFNQTPQMTIPSIIGEDNENDGVNSDGEDNEEQETENVLDEMDYKIINFIETFNQMKKKVKLEPTPVRVSTRSAIGKLTLMVNIRLFAHYVEHFFWQQENLEEDTCAMCMQFAEDNKEVREIFPMTSIVGMKFNNVTYGRMKKVLKKITKKTKVKRNFYNQITFLVQTEKNERPVNIKIFSNGSISMTGCKQEMDGFWALKGLVEDMRPVVDIFYQPEDQQKLDVIDYGITLINSDFSIGHKIDRAQLYKMVIEEYGLFATYEPTIYPGVKVTYMWNSTKEEQKETGLCTCAVKCLLKNRKKEKGIMCKKITIAIFQSGKIIITGSNTMQQTDDAYRFIVGILEENSPRLIRFSVNDIIAKNVPTIIEEENDEDEDEDD